MDMHVDVVDLGARLRAADQAFALATVVRTVSVTAAKAGAKAIITPDGAVAAGWIGGGCVLSAVLKAARDALADGEPRMVSVQPDEILSGLGIEPDEDRDGVRFAMNMCPSQGSVDVFVEPVLPPPSLIVLGASPVAISLASQARTFGFHVTVAAPAADIVGTVDADLVIDGFVPQLICGSRRFIVVSTQGKGDQAALRAAIAIDAEYHAFVGSRRKMSALRVSLSAKGIAPHLLDLVKAPAGLDLGAITPEEIAMSILAEITVQRRSGQRLSSSTNKDKRHEDE